MYQFFSINVEQFNEDALFNEKMTQVSPERREKIQRQRFRKDKNLSLGAAVLIDEGLQGYGLREKDMTYEITGNGKPVFSTCRQIHFNVSHSGEMAIAVFSDREIGCDIEKVSDREIDSLEQIARRAFQTDELAWMMAQPGEEEIRKAFYRLWTHKESYLKTLGKGVGEMRSLRKEDETGFHFYEKETEGYICAICEKEEAF